MLMILPALRVLLVAAATMSLAPLAGCGLKGDLVLPERAEQNSAPGESGDESANSNSESESKSDDDPVIRP